MNRYERRLQSLETEVCDELLAIGWPECEGDRIVAYHVEGERVDRHDGEDVGAFEQRVRDSGTAKYTILLQPHDVNL